jgi:hypothetical protein
LNVQAGVTASNKRPLLFFVLSEHSLRLWLLHRSFRRLQSMEPMQQVTRLRSVRLQQPSNSQAAAAAGRSSAALLDVRLAEETASQQAEHLVEMALAARDGS